jgi:basic amino acid/polyamine antiporter, APA family
MGEITQRTHSGLVRGIHRWDLVAFTINCIIGAGIFGLPSKAYGLAGTYSLLAFLICGFLAILVILCFAEVGSRFTETGGPYTYAREAFGPIVAFEVGWLLWLARLTAFAALCNLLISYLAYFWPPSSSGIWRSIIITVVVSMLTVINIIGVREAAITSTIFTVGKLLPLIFFVATGFFFINPQNYSQAVEVSYASFSTAALQLFFAFSGFEMAVIPTGEVRDPQRNIAFAMLTAIGVVVLIYILIQFVCIGTLPGLAGSERPLTDASSRFLGAAGASIISIGALISITGTLNAIMLAGPRIPFAMAEQEQLPSIFAATHPRFKTPYVTILLSAIVILVLTLSGTFIYALTISVIIRLVTYGVTCAALPILRYKKYERKPMFQAPAGVVVSIIALVLCAWLLSNSSWKEARDAAIAGAIGFPLYFLYKLKNKSL